MNQAPTNPDTPVEIDVHAVKAMIESKQDFMLIDCREVAEHEHCRIEDSHLIPMNELPDRLTEVELHRGKPIVVHCHHGGRSLQVVNWLRANGFPDSQNMTGGIEVWSCEIDPAVPRY